MGERRKWDKQPPAHEPFAAASAAAQSGYDGASAAAVDPVLEKQVQYIKMLEERNRLKKKLAASSKKEARDKQREDAFVTNFNVPAAAAGTATTTAAATATTTTQDTVRKNKSSASLLPTRMHTGDADRSRGRSAPSTALPLRHTPRGTEEMDDRASEAKPERAVRRAKWSKPAVGEAFGVESRNGKARLCVGAKDDEASGSNIIVGAGHSGDEEIDGGDDDYSEESFEEFEGTDNKEDESRMEEEEEEKDGCVVAHGPSSQQHLKSDAKFSEAKSSGRAEEKQSTTQAVATADASSSAGLSRTTTDLLSVIQNLSRSKQKALVDVLQKFESSAQQDSDIQTLQSSIGDPAIWKQVTTALFGNAAVEVKSQPAPRLASEAKPPALTIDHVMEEQRKWEEEYARQVQQRLTEEREAKEKALREAEQRRALLMRQMEEEERELERLMEQKRLQRLARLKALEDEEETSAPVIHRAESKGVKVEVNKTEVPSRREEEKPGGEKESKRGASNSALVDRQAEESNLEVSKPNQTSTGRDQHIVPSLVLPKPLQSVQCSDDASKIELRLRLLSTWGKTRAVGLTQICAYDTEGGEIDIDSSAVKVYEQADGRPLPKSHEMMRKISKLFNGIAQTNNDQDMWLGRLSDHGMLEIAFEVDTQPSKLCVWNYNSKMCSACVRDVEVLLGGKSVWSGSLPQGFGDEDDNTCTWISVNQGVKKTARLATSRINSDQEKPAPRSSRESTGGSKHSTSAAGDSVSSGPIWLNTSRSSSALSISKHEAPKAESKGDVLQDLEPSSARSTGHGSLTSRRQRGEPLDQGVTPAISKVREEKGESKVSSATGGNGKAKRDEFLARKERERFSGMGARASSWDSLEHFSKTSRSRLPSATEELPQTVEPHCPADESTKAPFVPTTTSALLTELRGPLSHASTAAPVPVPTTDHLASAYVPIDIPELPSGRRLKLEIIRTWGDHFYVGLNGIEIFDQRGKLITFANPDRQVIACPPSINVLDEYDDDPRVAKNLVDGVNCTCDDFHMWLAPFTQGEAHYITMSFEQSRSISMVRIWNYNKSRAHTCRGVRQIRLLLAGETSNDRGRVIFEGEITRAPGGIFRDDERDNAMWCEVILFTTDQSILKKIEANDALVQAYGQEQEEEAATSAIVTNVRSSMEMQRPKTADTGSDANNASQGGESEIVSSSLGTDNRRPITSAKRPLPIADVRKSIDTWMTEEPQQKSPVLVKVAETKEDTDEDEEEDYDGLIRGRRITLRLLSTWGDRSYIGLSQLDVLVGNHGTPIPLDISNIDATPRDLATLGYDGDPRTLDKLINGIGTTCDDANMWLVPFGATQEIRIDLKREQYIYGIRVWNYNKSLEDSFRGVKQLAVLVDGELISPRQTGFVLRKAPGTAYFDFDQIVRFETSVVGDKRDRSYLQKVMHPIQNRTYKTPNVRQDYEPALYPQGFVLKLVLWATWGDPYYVGLNGVELYDANGKRITTKPSIVTAQPHSLADIDHGSPQDDVRVPENLLSGKNKNTWDASDAWLAPLASSLGSCHGNVVFIVFDSPIVLSLVKFWNYSKTPERGVKDVDIYLDDIHIFSGSLRKAPHGNGGQNIGRFGPKQLVVEEFSQPVLFSTNQTQVDAEKRRVFYCGTEEQDVLCINEGQVVQESKAMYRKPDPGAEGVVVDLAQRPMTAMGRK